MIGWHDIAKRNILQQFELLSQQTNGVPASALAGCIRIHNQWKPLYEFDSKISDLNYAYNVSCLQAPQGKGCGPINPHLLSGCGESRINLFP